MGTLDDENKMERNVFFNTFCLKYSIYSRIFIPHELSTILIT